MADTLKKKKRVGITGGAGCGKTVVMKLLEERFHAGVVIADLIGHELMAPGQINYQSIVSYFGTEILNEDGTISRPLLSRIVFSDKEKLAKLNELTHPNIWKEIFARMDAMQAREDIDFIALESALLVESGYADQLDEMWYIYVNEETRIKRLMEGRGYSVEKSRSVIKNQLKEEEFMKNCQYVVDNSGSVEDTYNNIKAIINSNEMPG